MEELAADVVDAREGALELAREGLRDGGRRDCCKTSTMIINQADQDYQQYINLLFGRLERQGGLA